MLFDFAEVTPCITIVYLCIHTMVVQVSDEKCCVQIFYSSDKLLKMNIVRFISATTLILICFIKTNNGKKHFGKKSKMSNMLKKAEDTITKNIETFKPVQEIKECETCKPGFFSGRINSMAFEYKAQ